MQVQSPVFAQEETATRCCAIVRAVKVGRRARVAKTRPRHLRVPSQARSLLFAVWQQACRRAGRPSIPDSTSFDCGWRHHSRYRKSGDLHAIRFRVRFSRWLTWFRRARLDFLEAGHRFGCQHHKLFVSNRVPCRLTSHERWKPRHFRTLAQYPPAQAATYFIANQSARVAAP